MNNCPKTTIHNQLLVSISVGSVVTIFTLVILFLFCRVRRLNWLNKLEKFKTEHLFQAYQKSQQEAKDRNCVDLRWVGIKSLILSEKRNDLTKIYNLIKCHP